MKTNKTFLLASLLSFLFFFSNFAIAQETKTKVKAKTDSTKVKVETKTAIEPESRVESLSGINLFPNRKTGNFNLRFSQALKDNANLELKDTKGQVLYAMNLIPAEMPMAKPVDIGNLNAGIYLIEVKTHNTTYWKKVRVRK